MALSCVKLTPSPTKTAPPSPNQKQQQQNPQKAARTVPLWCSRDRPEEKSPGLQPLVQKAGQGHIIHHAGRLLEEKKGAHSAPFLLAVKKEKSQKKRKTRRSDESKLRGKALFRHSFGVQSIVVGESWRERLEEAGHFGPTVGKQRAVHAGTEPALFFLFSPDHQPAGRSCSHLE